MNPIPSQNKCKGRKKVEIKCIEKKESRQVCFSKRRQGLFKKASDLCTLCGAEVAIVVSSLAGKPYSFSRPSVEPVLRRFLDVAHDSPSVTIPADTSCSEPMNEELAHLREKLAAETRRRGTLEEALKAPCPKPVWWDSDLGSMGIEELRNYGDILLQCQAIVAEAVQQSWFRSPEVAMEQIEDPPAAPEVEKDDYYLWLEQQEDLDLAGFDFNYAA